MIWQSILLVMGVLFITGAAVKLVRWGRVQLAIRAIPADKRLRHSAGVDMRVELLGLPSFAGLHPTKGNRVRGDLVLAADQFLVATNRGVLIELTESRGRKLTSARCTGPMRLVLEGDVPRPDGEVGLYRFAIVVDDAEGWAESLQPWTREEAH